MSQGRPVFGVQEWAKWSVNLYSGCAHDCRYCYARDQAVRFGRHTPESWPTMRLREDVLRKQFRLRDGQGMFPSTHDILPQVLGPCLRLLENLLGAGNRVLVVSKPHVECVEAICERFPLFAGQVLFRFTVGASDDRILGFWEPNAPAYAERMQAAELARRHGFRVSFSVEPMLDADGIEAHVRELARVADHSVWVGAMNHVANLRKRLTRPEEQAALDHIEAGQTPDRVQAIAAALADVPRLRWKESFKKALGLPVPTLHGADR